MSTMVATNRLPRYSIGKEAGSPLGHHEGFGNDDPNLKIIGYIFIELLRDGER